MNNNVSLKNLGELQIIRVIESIIYKKTGKKLIRDDSLFFPLEKICFKAEGKKFNLVFNSDMLVSSTDVPRQMNYYNIGRKAILMNISDLLVKGVKPLGLIISFGLNKNLKLGDFKELMNGIIDYCIMWNIDYIGGDLNQTDDLIINPAVFGYLERSNIIYRSGLKPGDYLIANGKFGLTGVGFDILLNRKGDEIDFPHFKKSLESVLNPRDLGKEALVLSEKNLATASIDSSDGLAKSLTDLVESNPDSNIGFEIEFNEELIEKEAIEYSEKYNVPLEKLIFSGGEEFIHLFTVDPKFFRKAKEAIQSIGGHLFKIGKVIPENKIYYLKDNEKTELKFLGFEHFK